MRTEPKTINLPEGDFECQVLVYDEIDDPIIKKIYFDWVALSSKLRNFGGRAINVPEGLSEAIFCRAMNTVRVTSKIPKANTSFDVYHLIQKKRIQVKACSVLPDLSSFGPKSVWDEIYFMDFYTNAKWDGVINIYLIPNDLIYSQKVKADQTLQDQQKQKRRPRFSIYKEIIAKQNLSPLKVYQIT